MTGMILIDLQKAFGIINNSVILQKLYAIGSLTHTVNWFKSYLSNQAFLIGLENNFSQPASLYCGIPQGSILGPLLFLIHVNDMSQAVRSDPFLYGNDSCLFCQHNDINKIEKQLNEYFCNICFWFVDNKLNIYFGEHKTKSVLFATKFKRKDLRKLNIKYGKIPIKQHSKVNYLRFL